MSDSSYSVPAGGMIDTLEARSTRREVPGDLLRDAMRKMTHRGLRLAVFCAETETAENVVAETAEAASADAE